LIGGLTRKATAIAVIVTAVVLAVIALGTAIWYGLLLFLQPWGAALVLAAVMALVAGIVAFFTFGPPLFRKPEPEPESLTHRIIALAKERPIVATVAGLAASFIFFKNPALATIVAAAMSTPEDSSKRRR